DCSLIRERFGSGSRVPCGPRRSLGGTKVSEVELEGDHAVEVVEVQLVAEIEGRAGGGLGGAGPGGPGKGFDGCAAGAGQEELQVVGAHFATGSETELADDGQGTGHEDRLGIAMAERFEAGEVAR